MRLIGDGSSYQKMVKTAVESTHKAEKQLAKGNEQAQVFGRTIGQLGTTMSNFAGQMRAMAALQSPISVLYDSVRKAAESENLESSFGTMLQSAEKGKQLVQDIQELAAATPLGQADLSRTAQMLLQFKIAAGDVIPTLKMLGDVGGGNAGMIQRLARAYGQMKGTARVTNEELNQMREAGFYPLEEIAKKTGIAVADVRDEISKGNVPFSVFEQVLKDATSAGGQFYNGMENASKTLSGLFSTMQDDIDAAKRVIGAYIIEGFKLKEVLKEVSAAAQRFTEWFKGLTPETRKAILAAVLLTASFASLIVVWKVVAIMGGMVIGVISNMVLTFKSLAFYVNVANFSFSGFVKTVKAGLATLYMWAPYVGVFVALAAVVLMVVEELGGFEAAWQGVQDAAREALGWIKEKFEQFKVWVKPVTDALESLGVTAWAEFKAHAHAAWEFVKGVVAAGVAFVQEKWLRIGGDAVPTWDEIREAAVRTILFVEYSMTHLGEVSRLAWTGIKLYAVKALNFILEHLLYVFAGPQLLATMLLFQTNWGDVFRWIWDVVVKTVSKIVDLWTKATTAIGKALVEFIKNPTKGVSIDWGAIIGSNEDFFNDFKLRGLPDALGTRKIEEDLQKEFDDLKGGVFANFEEFYKKKMEEFAAFKPGGAAGDSPLKKVALDAAQTKEEIKGMTDALQRFDSVLIGSAEGKARVRAFKEMVGATKRITAPDFSARMQTVQYPGYEIANQIGGATTGGIKPYEPDLNAKGWAWLAGQATKESIADVQNEQDSARLRERSMGWIGREVGKSAGSSTDSALAEAIANLTKAIVDRGAGIVEVVAADLE